MSIVFTALAIIMLVLYLSALVGAWVLTGARLAVFDWHKVIWHFLAGYSVAYLAFA